MGYAAFQTILLTGASGFVGESILAELAGAGHRVIALCRRHEPPVHPNVAAIRVDLAGVDAAGALAQLPRFDAAIHAAGAPKFVREEREPMRRLHVDATVALARECARRGARLVHVSTAFVAPRAYGHLGEELPGDRAPANAYEKTKTDAERALAHLGQPGIEIVRPAIVVPEPEDDIDALRSSPLGAFMAVAASIGRNEALPGAADARLAMTRRGQLAAAVRAIVESPARDAMRWWNLCPAPFARIGDLAERLGGFRFGGRAAERLGAWEPYLRNDRSWSTDATNEGLRALGIRMSAVTAEDAARCCARLMEHARRRCAA